MGMMALKVRPLSLFTAPQNLEDYSDVFDLDSPAELHAQLKVTATTQTLSVTWQRSIDGLHWENRSTQTASSPGTHLFNETSSSQIYRFVRFKHVFTSGGGAATFEIDLYTKNFP